MPRGTPIRILRLSEALAGRGHEVHVAAYHLGSGPVGNGVQVHRIRDIPSYRKLGPGPSYRKVLQVDPALGGLLRRMLRDHAFDVIHAHHYEGLLVGAAARIGRRVPLVFDAHSLVAAELPYFPLGLPFRAKAAFGQIMDNALPRLADHTVCVTDVIRDALVGRSGLD
ncbi:MAG: glycosyltransferase family 4 protein, partial [Woeseiaceae bacterium]